MVHALSAGCCIISNGLVYRRDGVCRQDLFVQAMSLCQDTEYEVNACGSALHCMPCAQVRAMMCEQLATISRAVSAGAGPSIQVEFTLFACRPSQREDAGRAA